jgi:hypothetical protein
MNLTLDGFYGLSLLSLCAALGTRRRLSLSSDTLFIYHSDIRKDNFLHDIRYLDYRFPTHRRAPEATSSISAIPLPAPSADTLVMSRPTLPTRYSSRSISLARILFQAHDPVQHQVISLSSRSGDIASLVQTRDSRVLVIQREIRDAQALETHALLPD